MSTILISDSSEVFLAGLAKIIRSISRDFIIVSAKNNSECKSIMQHSKIDLLMFEVTMISGNFIQHMHDAFPNTSLFGYGTIKNSAILKEYVRMGLNGYLLRNEPRHEFEQAILKLLDNSTYFGGEIGGDFENILNELEINGTVSDGILNDRCREVLYLIYYEYTIKEIASRMSLSVKTIEGYRSKLLRMIGANNMVGLALFAEKNHIQHERDLCEKFKIRKREYANA